MKYFPTDVIKFSGPYIGRSSKGAVLPVWYSKSENSFYTFLPSGNVVNEETGTVKPTKISGIVEVAEWQDVANL